MGGAHLAQAGGRRVGPPRQWAGTLAWGACGAGLHYPPPRERGARSQNPWLAQRKFLPET